MDKYVISHEQVQQVINALVLLPFHQALPLMEMLNVLPKAVIQTEPVNTTPTPAP